jgi:hypothetical protein
MLFEPEPNVTYNNSGAPPIRLTAHGCPGGGMVDAADLKSASLNESGGSNPFLGTISLPHGTGLYRH